MANEVVRLERTPLLPPDVPPIPVFHFAFTRVGNQVLLEPGFVDLVELRAAVEQLRGELSPEPVPVVRIFIKEKYLLDRETLVRLRDATEEILQSMPESNEGEKP
ncbi:MAG TPA: hypothetical protein VIE43_13415 [Thermoanaerobaculia bacterium]|nr:hypothetical protein [Thermoanaerobaculia bacterium]